MSITFQRNIEVKYEADVVVAGGGIAGFCAACTAAKNGAKVILIERFAVAGGNATSGGVAAFCGETSGQGEIFDEIIEQLTRFNAIASYLPYEEKEARIFDHEILSFVLQEMLLSYKVKVLLHTRVVDAVRDGDKLEHCIIAGASGMEAVKGKVFIDCTGDGSLSRYAGVNTIKGRDSDGAQLPMSLMFFVRHIGPEDEAPVLPDGIIEKLKSDDELPMTSLWPNGPRANAIKIKIPLGDSTDTESLTQAEIRARRRMMQVLDYYRREKDENWMLDHCSPIIGIREGCRVMGDYMLTLDDLRAGKSFDDAIARGVFYLDGHSPDDDKRTYILEGDKYVPPYQIPLRSLIASGCENLLVSGRCFSAEQLALSSARVMTTCSMMGQAAGITASVAAVNNTEIRKLDYSTIRAEMEKRGAVL